MRTSKYMVSTYLPLVEPARAEARQRIAATAAKLTTKEELLAYLLSYTAIRFGQLFDIAEWLRTAGEAVPVSMGEELGRELCRLARVELEHRQLVLDDLSGIYRQFVGLSFRSLVRRPEDPHVMHHAGLRRMVPTRQDPLLTLALELELAELDTHIGGALLPACMAQLDPLDGRSLRARCEQSPARAAKAHQLLTQAFAGPHQARGCAHVAARVMLDFVNVLESCAEHGKMLAAHIRWADDEERSYGSAFALAEISFQG